MLLAAAEKGLGGCMIGNYNADSVKKELSLAENLAPVLIVAFGKPAEEIVIKEIVKVSPTIAPKTMYTTYQNANCQISS